MTKSFGTFSLALLGSIAFASAASAEMVHGSVQKLDAANNMLTIRRIETDKNQNLPQEMQLKVQRDSKLKNIASLQDLQNGNQVKVDVKQNKDLGIWEAKSVELSNEAHA